MTTYLTILFTFCLPFYACGQPKDIKGMTIDPSIKTEVEKHISPLEAGDLQKKILVYNNLTVADLDEEDELVLSTKEQDNKKIIFKSFYYWQGDTLGIDGAFGLFGGTGFTIKIVQGKATLYHMLASDDFPSYAYSEKDTLAWRLEVPCTDTKIILSEIPAPHKNQVLYGYVEFKSGDYYAGSYGDGQESLPRKKQRAHMKIYFKSAELDL